VKSKVATLIFDVDGVLVDVRGSFHRSTLQTVRHFTGKRVRAAEIQVWKSKGGYNDDWRLTTDWIASLGGHTPYEAVKSQFMKFYWGEKNDGNVIRERWLVPAAQLRRWGSRTKLALFTGRTRRELDFTLERNRVAQYFGAVVTMDDIANLKPHPDGLLRILGARDPRTALYLGDNVDDAIAAQRARVPFWGVLPRGSHARKERSEALRDLGALAILHSACEVEKWL
jgi:HAD superfamily hydrolase (TIGR01548 family)